MPICLSELPSLDVRVSLDGTWHGVWRTIGADHRFHLAIPPPGEAAPYIVVLPLDRLLELRADAVVRFWLALRGRPPRNRRHDLPPQTRARLILVLRALDGRLTGASYRDIAKVLLGFRGGKADWDSDPRKNQVRRLVADGLRFLHGGYRDLLVYPVRLPNRR
ncbi:Hypothetical protein GbCGDNIH6_8229 [Granulibacter bethesdensis]|uniref:DUF2285 domain-containing protein n=1 Tax=Granulibacter bethesdensis TaxID=364410 RepID=UPI000909BC84|nr:DUF2285 domain-containing protein [Granulibacter bethesdensis]APH56881.1 Hypothetical protein GbCGDNIH6_8229 [Granulibacter bethesdensis]